MAPKGKKGGTAARSKKASTARRDTVEASPRSRGSSSLSPVKSAQSQSQSQSQTQSHAQSITDGDEGEGVGLEDIEVNDDLMQLLESTQGIGYEQPSGELEGGGVEGTSVLPLDNAAMSMSQGMDVDMEGLDMDAVMGMDPSMLFGEEDDTGVPDYTGMDMTQPDGGEAEDEEEDGVEGEEDDDNDEEDEEEGDEEDGDEEDDEGEEEDDDDEEEDDDDEDAVPPAEDEDEDDEGAEEDDDSTGATTSFRYPASVPDFALLTQREKAFKIGRFVACTAADCSCTGLQPPNGADIVLVSRDQMAMEGGYRGSGMTSEGWWSHCGECGHGWEGDTGHVWPTGLAKDEKVRRGKVVGRIEELLHDEDLLTQFPTPHPESIESLLRQLQHFQKPTGGKKPAAVLPSHIDLRDSATPFSPRDDDDLLPHSDEERPRKRRRSGSDEEENADEDGATSTGSPKAKQHGKKPGGKTAGKGTKPRTVVRGARGLVPMETDAEGNQHVAGRLPDSALENGAEEDEDEEEDVPLAQRPQLDEGERRRREVIKEKEREREDEVLRRLAKGSNVEDGAEGLGRAAPGVDVEVWEGVELPKLPPRPAMVEQQKGEIRLIVVASTRSDPVSKILLIGLKNLFQRQLPKMPREYITRLVLDKKHISVAIVKKGWKVVGGICYRPFHAREFAEIVFCAIDSSEQIKGYGSHLMNSLKDIVRRDQPTVNHFLTYADNYAVGYFKKQGFTKEITLNRANWVGYIKDYEGGTIMQCTMLPKVKYLEVHQMLADQKAAVLAKIRTISRSHVVRPGLEIFRDRKPGQEIVLKKQDVPGLAESGWNPEIDEILRQPRRNPDHVLLQHVLNDLQNEPSAWPFVKPVDRNVVQDYDEVITNPMDLSTMEYKLENNHYSSVDDFLDDARLIFNNCRQYNGERSTYTVQANKLEKALDRIIRARQASR